MKSTILYGIIGVLIIVLFLSCFNVREGYTDQNTIWADSQKDVIGRQKVSLPDKYDVVVNARNIADNLGNSGYTSAPTYDDIVNPGYAKILEFNDELSNVVWDGNAPTTPSEMRDYIRQYIAIHNLQPSDPIPQSIQSTTGVTGTVSDLLNYVNSQLPADPTYPNASSISSIITDHSNTSYDYDHTTGMNNVTVFYGENNSTANLTNTNGNLSIVVYYGNGNKEVYKYSKVYDDQVLFDGVGKDLGKTAVITKKDNSMVLTIHSGDNEYTFYSNVSKNRNNLATFMNDFYYKGNTGSTGKVDPASQPSYPSLASLSSMLNSYDSLTGIPKSAIPAGKEDLYILKSEIVPPVCPVCPAPIIYTGSKNNSESENERPCPACERCPEPIVDCKKVIKYKRDGGGSSDNYYDYSNYIQSKVNIPVQKFNWFSSEPNLTQKGHKYSSTPPTKPEDEPMPVLNSFSSFGL